GAYLLRVQWRRVEFGHGLVHGGPRQARRPSDDRHTTTAQRAGLSRDRQPTLPFVEMRQQRRELLGKHYLDLGHQQITGPKHLCKGYFLPRPKRLGALADALWRLPSVGTIRCYSLSPHRR